MKIHIYRAFTLFLALVLLTSMTSAFALGGQYTDLTGHWAEKTLRQALHDGIIVGNEVRPDAPITKAEAVTLLCRVFKAITKADISDITDVTQQDWYYDVAAQGVAMGFLSPDSKCLNMNKQLKRSEAFVLIAKAFELIPAKPDTSVLSQFSDGETISGISRQATASLISAGGVQGSNVSLHMEQNITRAEFLTILYRIVSHYYMGSPTNTTSGTVISGDANVTDLTTSGGIYFDCTSSNVALQNVTAPISVLRSDTVRSFSLSSSRIERLVIAAQKGDIKLAPDEASQIGTVAIGTGGGLVTLDGTLSKVEITGNNRDVVISAPVDTLTISGSNNRVWIESDVSINTIQLLSSGKNNALTISGIVGSLVVSGKNSVIDGSGIVQNVIQNSECAISVQTDNLVVHENYGLNGVALTLNAPDVLPAGHTLTASVAIHAPANDSKVCQGKWYLNDQYVLGADVNLSSGESPAYICNFQYSRFFPSSAKLSFALCYTTENGEYQEIRVDRSIQLENYSKQYYDQLEINRVFSLVTTGYQGNYTLEWAKAHDYSKSDKELWVNAKGYSSKTGYLIWVNLTCQRVNVFTGWVGNWKLDRTFLAGTGAPGTDTPIGVFSTLGKLRNGWNHSTYTVKPVVTFIDSSYGFHSRIYYPGTTKVQDARIGFPVSHGCVRMYTEDINWFYQTIPTGTTVVVY